MEIYTCIRARTRRGRDGEAASACAALDRVRTLWTRACAPRSRGRPRARPASTRRGTQRVLTEILTRALTSTLARVLPGVLYEVLTGAYAGSSGVLPGCSAAEGRSEQPVRRTAQSQSWQRKQTHKHTNDQTKTNKAQTNTNKQTNKQTIKQNQTNKQTQTHKQTNLPFVRARRACAGLTASLTCMSAQSHRHTSTSPPAAVRPRP
jgi:hypothetical protein